MSVERQRVLYEPTGKTVDFTPLDGGNPNAVREYVTSDSGEQPPFTPFMDGDAYGEAVSGLPIVAVDVVVYDPMTGRVLVGKRDQEPQPDDWVIGGRMRAGESQEAAAIRNLKRELGAKVAALASDRLQPIGKVYNMSWDTREQGPTFNEAGEEVNGIHYFSIPMALAASEAEIDAIVRHNEEYSHLHWEDGFELYEAPAGEFHPAHQAMIFDTLERVATQP